VTTTRKLCRALRVSATLALALAAGSAGLSAGILCVGDDGHVAMELARAGRCADGEVAAELPSARVASPRLTASLPGSDCGPCTDVGVASGATLHSGRPTQADPETAPAAFAALPGVPSRHAESPARPPWPERAPAARSVLRGTILRC
jgi:hypothetical protein